MSTLIQKGPFPWKKNYENQWGLNRDGTCIRLREMDGRLSSSDLQTFFVIYWAVFLERQRRGCFLRESADKPTTTVGIKKRIIVHANNTCDFVMWPLRDMLLLFLDIRPPLLSTHVNDHHHQSPKNVFSRALHHTYSCNLTKYFWVRKKYEKLSKQYSTSCCCCCRGSGKTIK